MVFFVTIDLNLQQSALSELGCCVNDMWDFIARSGGRLHGLRDYFWGGASHIAVEGVRRSRTCLKSRGKWRSEGENASGQREMEGGASICAKMRRRVVSRLMRGCDKVSAGVSLQPPGADDPASDRRSPSPVVCIL